MEYLPDMGRRKSDLVTVAGISLGCLAGDNLPWKFSWNRLSDRLVDVSGTGDSHCLIDIGASGKWIPNGSA